MERLVGWVSELIRVTRVGELAASVGKAGLFILVLVLAIYLVENRNHADMGRYETRGFVTDVLYALFYRSALYAQFVSAAAANALYPHLEFLRFELLPGLPLAAQLAVYWVVADLFLYWIHRFQHLKWWLWAFHSVHHSQEHLTALSQYRRHPGEMLYTGLLVGFVFVIILGIPTANWLPLWMVMTTLQTLQHAELDWRYGFLYRIVVSPVFHSIHHSRDRRYYNNNLGAMFSVWDYLFGTAADVQSRPESYGVPGLSMPQSWTGQLVAPFGLLRQWRRSDRA